MVLITALTFVATVVVVGALFFAFLPEDIGIGSRLSRLLNTAPLVPQVGFAERHKGKVRDTLAFVGQLIPASGQQQSKTQLMMLRAGYRSPNALLAMQGVKILVPAVLLAVVYATGVYRANPFLYFPMAAVGGYLLPEMWLTWRVRSRQHKLRVALPDALDLLVICVEAGLGLDQALMRVSEELRVAHPDLSNELQLV